MGARTRVLHARRPATASGTDLLDYSGLASARGLGAIVLRPHGVIIATALELAGGNPLAAYRLLLKRFFQHVAVAARPDRDKTHGMIAPRRNTLPSLLATARATQTGIVLAAQNVMQFGNENERSCVFDACDTALILPDASAASVAQFHARLGHREVRRQAVSREFGRSRGPVSVSGESGDVLGSRKIMEPPFGRFPAFLHSSSDGVGAVAIELDHLTVSACDR